MPYDILEKQINALPEYYLKELMDFLEFLTQKAAEEKLQTSSLQKCVSQACKLYRSL